MTLYSRRKVLKSGAAITGGLCLAQNRFALGEPTKEPHFYLQLYYSGGFDSSYLFDARPLSFTAAGKIQNYLGQDPTPWVGSNGQSCLASSLVAPLVPFREHFSVINGVLAPSRDDGHDQNRNVLFTGNSFGGESYFPFLNEVLTPRGSLDFFISGDLSVPFSNGMSSISLKAEGVSSFSKLVANSKGLSSQEPAVDFVRSRLQLGSNGPGRFSEGIRNMLTGLNESYSVANKFRNIDTQLGQSDSRILKELKSAHKLFVSGITNTFVISDVSNRNNLIDLDTHDGESASQQPATYAAIVAEIAETFSFLKSTVFDESKGLSLLDVTTVLISSEFNRTNYQEGMSMDKTGTDHNSLSNMMLIGGKGIKGGQVIGATDLDVLDDKGLYQNLSKAHLEFDPELIKRMGKPFDFDTMRPASESQEDFNADQYLTMASIANTILKMYGCDESKYWSNTRNSGKAKILSGLLT
ncbi:MAG: DUF1501 domain-containing protein [Pseudomonadota bacterium]